MNRFKNLLNVVKYNNFNPIKQIPINLYNFEYEYNINDWIINKPKLIECKSKSKKRYIAKKKRHRRKNGSEISARNK